MPEGPEVKIITDNFNHFLKGKMLRNVIVVKEGFRKKTKNLDMITFPIMVKDVVSKGKFCYIALDDGNAIGLTFGMTGNIRVDPGDAMSKKDRDKYMKHCAVKFETDLDIIYYGSMRHFGSVIYMSAAELKAKLASIGPCILDPNVLDVSSLCKIWRKTNKNICVLLLDQKYISGIGNYLKAEILHTCGRIDPFCSNRDLIDEQLYQLYMEARRIAHDAYKAGGASLYTYTGISGDQTEFKTQLKVYGRTHDPLGRKVTSVKTPDGRTTFWIPPDASSVAPMQKASKPRIMVKIKQKLTNDA